MKRNIKNTQSVGIPADFVMPSTQEIEEILLGELLIDRSALPHVAALVNSDMFSEGNARNLWMKLTELDSRGEAADIFSIPDMDNKYLSNVVEKAGTFGVSTMNILQHASYLRTYFFKVQAFKYGYDIIRVASSPSSSEEHILEKARLLLESCEHSTEEAGVQDMVQLANDLAQEIEDTSCNHVTTGFIKMDNFFYGGFPKGALVVLAGRPGAGKTSVACFMMRKAAEDGAAVLMINLEQTCVEIYKKLICGHGDITPDQISAKTIDWEKYELAVGALNKLHILVDEQSRSIEEIVYRIYTLHRQGRCDIAFIDYLGLIPAGNVVGMTKGQAIGEITHKLKALAKDLKIPIVLLCQLNREMAKENRPPQLTDLRDSGDIEQDADKVLMLERTNDDGLEEVDIWIRKNRQGKAGNTRLRLVSDETYTNFYDMNEV